MARAMGAVTYKNGTLKRSTGCPAERACRHLTSRHDTNDPFPAGVPSQRPPAAVPADVRSASSGGARLHCALGALLVAIAPAPASPANARQLFGSQTSPCTRILRRAAALPCNCRLLVANATAFPLSADDLAKLQRPARSPLRNSTRPNGRRRLTRTFSILFSPLPAMDKTTKAAERSKADGAAKSPKKRRKVNHGT